MKKRLYPFKIGLIGTKRERTVGYDRDAKPFRTVTTFNIYTNKQVWLNRGFLEGEAEQLQKMSKNSLESPWVLAMVHHREAIRNYAVGRGISLKGRTYRELVFQYDYDVMDVKIKPERDRITGKYVSNMPYLFWKLEEAYAKRRDDFKDENPEWKSPNGNEPGEPREAHTMKELRERRGKQ